MLVYCLRPEEWTPGLYNLPFAKVTGILAFLSLLLSCPNVWQRFPREVFYLALLIGQLFLAAAFSPIWRGGAIRATLGFAKVLIVVVIMAVTINTLRRLRLLIFTQVGSLAVLVAVILWKGHFAQGRLVGIFHGDYADPNDLALAIVISIPLCVSLLYMTKSQICKIAWTSVIVAMTLAVFMTGSRGGFLSLIISTAVLVWEFAIRGRRIGLLASVALLTVILVHYSSGMVIGRLKDTFNLNGEDSGALGSAQARKFLFLRSIEVTEEHPLFGVGPGNFELVSGDWHVAHNSFTQISSEGGILALILYVLILVSAFRNIRTAKRFAQRQREVLPLARALRASLVGYVVGSCFLSVNYSYFPYFLIGYTTALIVVARRSAVQSNQQVSILQVQFEKKAFTPLSEIPL